MKFFALTLTILLSSWCGSAAQKTTTPLKIAPPVRVSVLGYHEFTSSQTATEMRLPVNKLRKQLQAIKDNNLNVITLDDFLAWKKGKKNISDKSILITIDDGWKSVYDIAYPVFKEFGYPFTVYLYKNYVDGGGKALTTKMIKEMQQNGCSIGCHSTSHPFPAKVKRHKRKGKNAYSKFLDIEMGDSKKFLETKFGKKVTTYAYPGGFSTEEMYAKANQHGYDFLFTVLPGKIQMESENHILNRYIILGTHDYIFKNAITFRDLTKPSEEVTNLVVTTPHPVHPSPATAVADRTPTISANLQSVENLDPNSVQMLVAGFGKVPLTAKNNKTEFSWKTTRPFNTSSVEVIVKWKQLDAKKYQAPMKWTFLVDTEADYQPRTPLTLPLTPTEVTK